ncbi:hypothetical protein E2C01_070294 [Portunus trituberculatus]|uniref:Uncharacterized protein n=1 Tax=Portunus trituberculatus TaxID=210409 RepID=A0A5B7I173_PORTR|nr:hypothetical protein [Portunus trituberculatus]
MLRLIQRCSLAFMEGTQGKEEEGGMRSKKTMMKQNGKRIRSMLMKEREGETEEQYETKEEQEKEKE